MKYIKLFENFDAEREMSGILGYDVKLFHQVNKLIFLSPEQLQEWFEEEIEKDEPNLDLIKILETQHGIEFDLGYKDLHWAAWDNKVGLVKYWLNKGVDKDAQGNNLRTPLHQAAINDNEAVAKLLIDAGANKDAQDGFLQTPLHWAAQYDKRAVAKLLIDAGARTDIRDMSGETALDLAKKKGEVISMLFEDRIIDRMGAKYSTFEIGKIQNRPFLNKNQIESLLKTTLKTKCIIGIRGFYLSKGKTPLKNFYSKNDRGIYDDAIFIYDRVNIVGFNANTDPGMSGFNPDLNTQKGYATLSTGTWKYKIGLHKGYEALVQQDDVKVYRDAYDDVPSMTETGMFGINIHRGGDTTVSSKGCQTIRPDQYDEFMSKVKSLWSGNEIVTYMLIENKGNSLA
jgi:lysozyme